MRFPDSLILVRQVMIEVRYRIGIFGLLLHARAARRAPGPPHLLVEEVCPILASGADRCGKCSSRPAMPCPFKRQYIVNKMDNGEFHERFPLVTYQDACLRKRCISITPDMDLVDEELCEPDEVNCFKGTSSNIPQDPEPNRFVDRLANEDIEVFQGLTEHLKSSRSWILRR